ncbi:MAG: hypothetical protein IPG25_11970 [Proteobacteria bacterium]|nr:hypothetical protein [Pseudomonadota bacterium]
MGSTSSDARFDRYYRRIQLGLRLLAHGARAQTACDWSGLTPDRLITLKRRWLPDAGDGFRGPAPTSFQPFFRSAVRLANATVFASIHHSLCQRSIPPGESWELQPGLENGERLCSAFEIFREWEPDADLEFDQAALLARGAANSENIELLRCLKCHSAMLIDKWARRREVCSGCRSRRDANP